MGSVRLLDYGVLCPGEPVATVLLVPSLINKYYILDLSEKQSFARYLASQNIYPIVLDWGVPTQAEQGFDMADYVQKRLMPAIEFCAGTAAAPLHLLGYCLGGVLTLAAAQLLNASLKSISLLATPWDFSKQDVQLQQLTPAMLQECEAMILEHEVVPAEFMQHLFLLRQPFAFAQKFMRFAHVENAREAEEFMLLEGWVNDGVAMSAKAARDCLIDWIQRNALAEAKWCVDGQVVQAKTHLPCFISMPKHDAIVPYGCALALAEQIPHATLSAPSTGHVGMIVGSRAKKQLWEPYVEFIQSVEM